MLGVETLDNAMGNHSRELPLDYTQQTAPKFTLAVEIADGRGSRYLALCTRARGV